MEEPTCTNTQAEAMVIVQALRYMKERQYQQIIIETDSLLLKNIILKVWEIPWQIIEMVEEIWRLMNNKIVRVIHIMREGNMLADHLANLALDHGEVDSESFQELGIQGRRWINNDKLQLPYLRIRPCKR
ncbi:uncharacterized protein LOC132624750 [Lycium barbarum]|uniref:uncharacterized protein LOC132624750 n=1 Tax=Lycium barbarum TaxID=112863 RepID=UPI00293F3D8B|nr:uncharacterized protein LOC132624750 [Lycium barbarum]